MENKPESKFKPNKALKEKAKEETTLELENLGFQKVEGTDYFKGDGFLISIDPKKGVDGFINLSEGDKGSYSYFMKRTLSEIADIKIGKGKYSDEPHLTITSLDKYAVSEGINESSHISGGTFEEVDRVEDIEQRLLEQGFHELSSTETETIYQLATAEGNQVIISLGSEKLNFVGIRRNNRLPREDLLFRDGTHVVGYREPLMGEYRPRKTPHLQLENDLLSYEIQIGSAVPLKEVKFKSPITDEIFPLNEKDKFVQPAQQEGSMNIGMPNDTKLLKNLKEINKVSIEELEKTMRPDEDSQAGFLGEDESFLDVLAEDNETIKEYGITHQDIARKLFTVTKALDFVMAGLEFEYGGQKFRVEGKFTKGMQHSPFKDKTGSSHDVILTNLETEKTITFSRLHPDMIHRYGFYEGQGTSYRLDPKEVIEIFGVKKKGENK